MHQRPSKARAIVWWMVLAAGIALGVSPVFATEPATTVHAGVLEGAPYRIDIPAGWNGDLVMLMHGYEPAFSQRKLPMHAADATHVFVQRGYAVAQSEYASRGWAVRDAVADNERLRRYFVYAFKRPAHTYIYGFSLGGLETVASIERYRHTYAGALAMCGTTVSTPELMSRAVLTPLVAFDALIPGVLPDLAAAGSPSFVPPNVFAKALQAHPQQAAVLNGRLQETPERLPGALMLYYMVLREFDQRAGGMPVDNRHTVYHGFGDDASFNQRVHRYAGSPSAMAYAKTDVTVTGNIATPLVMQWNAFDPTIPARFHPVYPEQVRAAGNGKWLTILPPVGDGHCEFTDQQLGAAFQTLVHKAGSLGH
ncbi:hypothetical protein PY254_17855 [Rhodanobacter sp. AS-Z3]|uniref:hypothetical protein n=1 Tax=Rhodanobacter sp. AS-Z3 TaxID=3031330 RepID=UPI00247AFC77|nr:hypothetical protein [Rhodanobacter sp. AS-Z3]WEN15068.1 hypothetical protein PY254_17855 [Rhodanobacter sp. AS-Z3]